MAGSLDGIRVLDLSRLLPGPFLTMVLADMGADVIKIEAPGAGDYMRHMPPLKGGLSGGFIAVNRNKRSVVLDLKRDESRETFLKLCETADVVVESFRPGVIDRLGIGYDQLAARNPKIVLCSISGYGQSGPYRLRAGHDLNYCSLAGMIALGGERDGAPAIPGVQNADLAGGALWAAVAILGALVSRDKTGKGEHLDISMTEGSLALLAPHFGFMDSGGPVPTRGKAALFGGLACYSIYRTKDDKYLSVGALEPKFWMAFNAAIGRNAEPSEVIAPPPRQDEIRAEVQAILLQKDRDEWVSLLADVDACCEPVLELDEVQQHPQHRERGVFFELELESGEKALQVRLPVGTMTARRPPKHGEHTDDIVGKLS